MRKFLITLAAVIAGLALIAGILTLAYAHSDDFTGDILPENITINGVNCSGLSYQQATEEIGESWNSKHIQVVGKLGETLADYTDFDCTYDIKDQLATIKQDHLISAALNHYLHVPFSATVAMNVQHCGGDFAKAVKNSEFLNKGNVTETKDAYVDLNDPAFPIIAEVYGNKVSEAAYLDDILHAISMGQFRFEFDENAYMSIPEVKSDDPELIKYQEFCVKYLGQNISYKLGDESFSLTAEELQNLMTDDMSGEADESKVAAFAKSLKKKYDIVGGERKFTSLTGKTFTVNGGDYGWIIDEEAEAKQLAEDINSHKDVNREPEFSQKGQGEYSRTLDLGDTYIDIDITKQHVVYFEKGKKKFETDCVSGCVIAGHSTPTGVYQIRNKLRNITLKGGGKKGSKGYYESPVSYWMAFIGGSIGLHDATWRSNFGGEIYKTAGSHGCVNLPLKNAGKLYNMISIGTPVICHK